MKKIKKDRKIITFGGATRDIMVDVAEGDLERMSMRNAGIAFLLLEQGRKIESKSINISSGGGAINCAIGLKRLGNAAVNSIVKIGKDSAGKIVKQSLVNEKVDTSLMVIDDDHATATSVMIFSHDRDPTIFIDRGANAYLKKSEINFDTLKEYNHIHIGSLSNQSAVLSPIVAEFAKSNGLTVSSNPGVRQLSKHSDEFINMLSNIDILSINTLEATKLLPYLFMSNNVKRCSLPPANNPTRLMLQGLSSGDISLGLRSFCLTMLSLGVKCLVITDGSNGAYTATEDGLFFCSTLKIKKIVGTPGAGDSFNSAFIDAWLSKLTPYEMLIRGTLNAASVVKFTDTQSGLLSEDQMTKQIAKNKDKLTLLKFDI